MADETTPLPEIPESFDGVEDDALRGMWGELEAAYQAARQEPATREMADRLTQIREAQRRVSAEVSDRIGIANDLQALDDDAPILPEPPAPADPDAPPADPDPETTVVGDPIPAGTTQAVTAAITAEDMAGQRDGTTKPPDGGTQRPRTPLVVTAGLGGGQLSDDAGEIDFGQLAVMVQRAKGNPGDAPEKVRLASVSAFDSDAAMGGVEMMGGGDTEYNDRLIRESVDSWRTAWDALDGASPEARTAAICTPLDIIRDIPDCTQSSEPFSDALPSRPAGRLGFQYTPGMSLATMATGVVWDEADQAAVSVTDQATWKACVKVTCPTASTVTAEAIVACMYFDITTDMSNPERIRDAMSKIAAVKARTKTARLLQITDTLSHHFSFSAPYGALAGLIQAILTTLPQGEYPERLDDGTPYIVFTPPGLLEALVIDRANKAFLTDAERGEIAAYVRDECAAAGWNVRLVDLADVAVGTGAPFPSLPTVGAAAVALPALGGGSIGTFRIRIVAPEGALYFSTGEMNTGVERSPDLMRRNQAQWFMEEFVGLAKHGCHPWYTLHMVLCPNGTRGGTTTPFSCAGSPS